MSGGRLQVTNREAYLVSTLKLLLRSVIEMASFNPTTSSSQILCAPDFKTRRILETFASSTLRVSESVGRNGVRSKSSYLQPFPRSCCGNWSRLYPENQGYWIFPCTSPLLTPKHFQLAVLKQTLPGSSSRALLRDKKSA